MDSRKVLYRATSALDSDDDTSFIDYLLMEYFKIKYKLSKALEK